MLQIAANVIRKKIKWTECRILGKERKKNIPAKENAVEKFRLEFRQPNN